MNEMNLEKQLHSWRPRRPSAGIKLRLFREGPSPRKFVWAIRWFAPTAACGLVALAALHQDGFYGDLNSRQSALAHVIPAEKSGIAGVMINRSPEFFEWTNHSGSPLNVRSFLPGTTN